MANVPRTYHCSFCGKSNAEVRKLISNRDSTYLICNYCTMGFDSILESDAQSNDLMLTCQPCEVELPSFTSLNEGACSFCGRSRSEVQNLFQSETKVCICNRCITLTKKILIYEEKRGSDLG